MGKRERSQRAKLRKGEYIDHNGKVRQHSTKYYARQRQLRLRLAALGLGLALVVALVLLLVAAVRGRRQGSVDGSVADGTASAGSSADGVTRTGGEVIDLTLGAGGSDGAQVAGGTEAYGATADGGAAVGIADDAGAGGAGGALGGGDSQGTMGGGAASERPGTAERIAENLARYAHPDRFYGGYTVYGDASTRQMYAEDVYSTYGVLVDLADGHVVAEREAYARMYPASMTKVMTILTAAGLVADYDDTFVMTQEITNFVYSHGCSQVGYAIGEEMSIRELFYGTIMPSGGDAAMALAIYCSGSVEAFADEMNRKAQELGLDGVAHFSNPIGLHSEDNYVTPVAMAMIMKAALENDICREALGQKRYTTAATPEHPEGIELSNWFLRRIEDKDTHGEVLGAKTGFVDESGCCAVSYARSDDGHEYICVTGNAWSSWRAIYDHVAIYVDFTK